MADVTDGRCCCPYCPLLLSATSTQTTPALCNASVRTEVLSETHPGNALCRWTPTVRTCSSAAATAVVHQRATGPLCGTSVYSSIVTRPTRLSATRASCMSAAPAAAQSIIQPALRLARCLSLLRRTRTHIPSIECTGWAGLAEKGRATSTQQRQQRLSRLVGCTPLLYNNPNQRGHVVRG